CALPISRGTKAAVKQPVIDEASEDAHDGPDAPGPAPAAAPKTRKSRAKAAPQAVEVDPVDESTSGQVESPGLQLHALEDAAREMLAAEEMTNLYGTEPPLTPEEEEELSEEEGRLREFFALTDDGYKVDEALAMEMAKINEERVPDEAGEAFISLDPDKRTRPRAILDEMAAEVGPTDEEIEAFLAEEAEAQRFKIERLDRDNLAREMLEEHGPVGHEHFGPRLGTAEFVGQYEDGSPEWHEARSKGIGGSDAASILGIGFTSAFVLWQQKKGHFGPDKVDDRMEEIFLWGHLHEDALRKRFLMNHPEWEFYEGGSWRKADAPWMLANTDGILVHKETGELAIWEAKSSEQGSGWENDRCPSKYVVQPRHYMHVFGFRRAFLVVKIGNSDYREFEVPADITQPVTKIFGGTQRESSFIVDYGDGQYLEQ